MPVNISYPGVYIDELTGAVRTIVGVPTAVAAFVGPAARGPVDAPTHIISWADFERIYGGLPEASLMSYAVFHYYQNGGSEAEIVRVVNQGTTTDAWTIDLGNGVKLVTKVASGRGKIGAQVSNISSDAKTYTLTIRDARSTPPVDTPVTVSIERAKSTTEGLMAVLAGNATTNGLVQPDHDAKVEVFPVQTPLFMMAVGNAAEASIKLADNVQLTASSFGKWGNNLRVRVDHDVADLSGPSSSAVTLYNLTIRDTGTGAQENFRNIVAGDPTSPQRLKQILQRSVLVRVEGDSDPIDLPAAHNVLPPGDPFADHQPSNSHVATDAPPNGFPYTQATGGADGPPVGPKQFTGDGATTGMYLLNRTDIFTILCIPPVRLEEDIDVGVLNQAMTLCYTRRAMLLVDPPAAWRDVTHAYDAVKGALPVTGDSAKNAAVYFPRIQLPDQNGQLQDFPPCGAIAGVWARTDGQRGVWKAPAGQDASLNGVRAPSVKLTDLENGELNPFGLNCIRAFPIVGTVVWGARTAVGADRLADPWKYIPVRRTALYLEESLYRGLQWVVFEPNDEPLWAAIRLNVGAFMNSLFRQGAFQGRTPQQAYLVKCDAENNPQNDIDRGIVNILVGFAPLKPAEFVLIHIQQLAGQLQT